MLKLSDVETDCMASWLATIAAKLTSNMLANWEHISFNFSYNFSFNLIVTKILQACKTSENTYYNENMSKQLLKSHPVSLPAAPP